MLNQDGSQVSWFLDQSFYGIMVTILSCTLKANVPAVLCAVLCTVQVRLVWAESLRFDRFGGVVTNHP